MVMILPRRLAQAAWWEQNSSGLILVRNIKRCCSPKTKKHSGRNGSVFTTRRCFPKATSATFMGEVELRGLKAGSYHVVDYADGKDLGKVEATADKAPRLATQFKE